MNKEEKHIMTGDTFHNDYSSSGMSYLIYRDGNWHHASLSDIYRQAFEIDFISLISTIVYGRTAGNTSLFKNIACIAPGVCCKVENKDYGSGVSEYIDWDRLQTFQPDGNAAEILYQTVSTVVDKNPGKYYVIRLSGGLDSTGILLALMESVSIERIIAVTYSYPQGASNEDERIARELCAKFKIRLLVIDFSPYKLFQKTGFKVAPVLSTKIVSIKVQEEELECLMGICGENFIIFDGHGGDHVFCEKIPSSLALKLFTSFHPIKALQVILSLARLQGSNLKEALFTKKREIAILDAELTRFFILESKHHVTSAYRDAIDQRKNELKEAILDNGIAATLQTAKYDFYPFTSKEMIRYGLHINPAESFNSTYRRLQYRNAINERYQFTLTRRDKGHITGAYQAALNINKARVMSLLTNGQLAKNGFLNIPEIKMSIESMSRGIGGFSFILLKIIAAEIIFEGYMQ